MSTSIDFGPLSGPPPVATYTPAVPANWLVVPTAVYEALDFLSSVNASLYPAVFHVTPGLGNDAKAGRYNAPFNTLQAAITHVRAQNLAQVIIYLHSNTIENIVVPAGAFAIVQSIAVIGGRDLLPIQISGSFTCQQSSTNIFTQLALYFHNIYLPTTVTIAATATGAVVDLFLYRSKNQNNALTLAALRRLEIVDSTFADLNLTITNCATTYSIGSTFRNLSTPGALFVSDGTAPNHPQGTGNMIIEVFGKHRVLGAVAGADFNSGDFNGSSPLFSVVNGGSPIFCRVSDEFIEPVSPAVIPAGATFELVNSRSLSDITVNTGGVLTTSQSCRLPAVTNNGTWTDYGSTVVSVAGDGTTTYNGTAIASIPTITAASRTQLRTDSALDFDATANSIAYNLLPLASTPLNHAIRLTRLPGGAANLVTITPSGAETIDGLPSLALAEYQYVRLVNKGTFWSAQV